MYERVYITQTFIKRFKAVKEGPKDTFYFKNNLGLKLINPCTIKALKFCNTVPLMVCANSLSQ